MSAKYKAAIIGHTGQGDYGHGLDMVYKDMSEVAVVAVADLNPAGLDAAKTRCQAERGYTHFEDMLEKETVDIVNVCPRVVTYHGEMVRAVALSSARALFCEKPLAATLREADSMLKACREGQVCVAVAHRRANPYEQLAKRWVDEGRIGQLQVVRTRGKWDQRSGGEDLAVLGPHMMDSMRYMAGSSVKWVHAHIQSNGKSVRVEDAHIGNEGIGLISGDQITAHYAFKNGVTGYFESLPNHKSTSRNTRHFGFEIHGTEGILSLRNSPNGEMYIYKDGLFIPNDEVAWERVYIDEWEAVPLNERTHYSNVRIVKELLEAMEKGSEVVEASSGEDALAAQEMIVAVHESHIKGGRVGLPLVNRENPYSVGRSLET